MSLPTENMSFPQTSNLNETEDQDLISTFTFAEAATLICDEARENIPSSQSLNRNRPENKKEYYVDHIFAEKTNKEGEVLGYFVKWEDC
jgi:hypothetical protein